MQARIRAIARTAAFMLAVAAFAIAGSVRAEGELTQFLRERAEAAVPAPSSGLAAAEAAFYQRLGFQPAWIGHPERLQQLRSLLEGLRDDGLSPEHYGLALLDQASPDAAEDQQAALDWQITQGFLLAMLHLYRGKLDPHELDAMWNVERRPLDVEAAVESAAAAVEGDSLEAFATQARPAHPIYSRLREALHALRQLEADGGWPAVGPGPTIEPDMDDPRVPLLRRRLALGGYGPENAGEENESVYDADLQAAVRRFQEEQYLEADGRVGRATVAALDVPVAARIGQVRANLERSRWLLPELAGDFVLVDIAGYRLRYFHDGEPEFVTRVQVGQPFRRTPIFRASITYLTLNPAWVIPPTILEEDALPKIRGDKGYLSRNRLHVIDADGRERSPRTIDWSNPPRDLMLRQDAGADGALGRIAIRFPNPYSVYLHETPHTELFSAARRAFSSGCIRVEQPFDLALLLLGSDSGWTRESLDAVVATGKTTTVTLPHPVPILLMYWTVDAHRDGLLSYKPDVYGLDAATLEALDRAPE